MCKIAKQNIIHLHWHFRQKRIHYELNESLNVDGKGVTYTKPETFNTTRSLSHRLTGINPEPGTYRVWNRLAHCNKSLIQNMKILTFKATSARSKVKQCCVLNWTFSVSTSKNCDCTTVEKYSLTGTQVIDRTTKIWRFSFFRGLL